MDVRQEIPIKSFTIAAYLCRVEADGARFLIVKRRTAYLTGTWQMVSGKVEKGETAWQAALREIREETGLVPERLYSADATELLYEASQNCINIVPVFVGFVEASQAVKLSAEHSEYRWVSAAEAAGFLTFRHQVETMRKLEAEFVERGPLEFLRIKPA